MTLLRSSFSTCSFRGLQRGVTGTPAPAGDDTTKAGDKGGISGIPCASGECDRLPVSELLLGGDSELLFTETGAFLLWPVRLWPNVAGGGGKGQGNMPTPGGREKPVG